MEIERIFKDAINCGASDIFIIAGLPLTFKINGMQKRFSEQGILKPDDTLKFAKELYQLSGKKELMVNGETTDEDFSVSINGIGRFRVNMFVQRGSIAAVIRVIKFGIPDAKEYNIPDEVMNVADRRNGIVLVTGQAGSGKSTTLACIIDRINSTREGHILTLEDPLEYVHRHNKCIVSQREIGNDCDNYLKALKSALRESPDVILLGELRDSETMEVAMTAAETGQLLFSTLHTTGAANTIDRIIDAFPPNQQVQIRNQLAMVLKSVISQVLVPGVNGEVIPVFEIMHMNLAIRNLVREGKIHQIESVMASN
ncbi:MAG: PilT/PilU family type 4a pilus ATPase, partial [Clostridia bacterium]|nr:PilT/PilU family type 4a pilus ATPase [Clostridia bacterium]